MAKAVSVIEVWIVNSTVVELFGGIDRELLTECEWACRLTPRPLADPPSGRVAFRGMSLDFYFFSNNPLIGLFAKFKLPASPNKFTS